MYIYHGYIFFLYIIHQNNPVSKSLRCMISWFSPQPRSRRLRATRYRRRDQATVVTQLKLPSSVISENFAYSRLAVNLSGVIVQKQGRVRVCRFGARCIMPRVSLLQIWERSVVAKKREQAKTSRSERPRRCHLDDGSFARLPPVKKI